MVNPRFLVLNVEEHSDMLLKLVDVYHENDERDLAARLLFKTLVGQSIVDLIVFPRFPLIGDGSF